MFKLLHIGSVCFPKQGIREGPEIFETEQQPF